MNRERRERRGPHAIADANRHPGVRSDVRLGGRARQRAGRAVEREPRRPVLNGEGQPVAVRILCGRHEHVGLVYRGLHLRAAADRRRGLHDRWRRRRAISGCRRGGGSLCHGCGSRRGRRCRRGRRGRRRRGRRRSRRRCRRGGRGRLLSGTERPLVNEPLSSPHAATICAASTIVSSFPNRIPVLFAPASMRDLHVVLSNVLGREHDRPRARPRTSCARHLGSEADAYRRQPAANPTKQQLGDEGERHVRQDRGSECMRTGECGKGLKWRSAMASIRFGNPAVIDSSSLDRKLCVPIFRWVCLCRHWGDCPHRRRATTVFLHKAKNRSERRVADWRPLVRRTTCALARFGEAGGYFFSSSPSASFATRNESTAAGTPA